MPTIVKRNKTTVRCEKCDTDFSFRKDEVSEGTDYDEGVPYKYKLVVCPVCKRAYNLLPKANERCLEDDL